MTLSIQMMIWWYLLSYLSMWMLYLQFWRNRGTFWTWLGFRSQCVNPSSYCEHWSRLPTAAHTCTIHPTPKLKSSTWTTAKPSSYKITTSGSNILVLNKNKIWKMPGKHVIGIFADFRREGKSSHSNCRIFIKNVCFLICW